MELVGKLFSVGMPIFAVLVLGEKLYGHLKGNDTVPYMDALSSSYSGLTFVTRALFGFGITIVSYQVLFNHLAIWHIPTTWLTYVVAFIVLDFEGYWGHRLVHQINFLWNRHLIHHSSQEYNLACALRQSISEFVHVLFFLGIPAAVVGLSPAIVAVVFPVHKLAQYWYHTRLINKLGFLEHIIVTPSHHRVHHALNPIYIDKNYSPIFIIWDKLFGTFQPELESEPPVYGITRPSQTRNPITINFEHFFLMLKDAWRTDSWADKLTIWFRPTGWRPEGFDEKYPVQKITDPYNFPKFNPQVSSGLVIWSSIQFFTLFFFVIYILHDVSVLTGNGLYLFAAFMAVQVYSATELMNRNKYAFVYSLLSALVCFTIYYFDRSWFGIHRFSALLPALFTGYLSIQPLMAFTFSQRQASNHWQPATHN